MSLAHLGVGELWTQPGQQIVTVTDIESDNICKFMYIVLPPHVPVAYHMYGN